MRRAALLATALAWAAGAPAADPADVNALDYASAIERLRGSGALGE